MTKIIKIEEGIVLIGTDEGKLIIVKKSDCAFEPITVGTEVEVYSNENRTVVIKKEVTKAPSTTDNLKENPENSHETKLPVVYYGISGSMKAKFNQFVEITGEPEVIVERDNYLSQYPTKLFDKYDVVSLDEALERYPNAIIYITYQVAKTTARRVLKKVEPDRIKFLQADLEYRDGCSFLGHYISYRAETFSPCCIGNGELVQTSGSISDRVQHWKEYTVQLVDNIKNHRPNKCDGCRFLKKDFWQKSVKLDYFCLATSHPGDVCNLKCTYCFVAKRFKQLNSKDAKGYTTYETLKQLSEIPEYDDPKLTIELSNGELCANKYCDEIFDILLKSKWRVRFVSNMSIYKEKFAEFMKTGRVMNILTSLDSGTPETFKAIKGVDCFDKVVDNLKKYPLEDVDFKLKYIFLDGVNDNIKDVDGFLKVVKKVGCKSIVISSDNCKPYTETMEKMAIRLIEKARKNGIRIEKSSYLSKKDSALIDEYITTPV